MMSIVLTLFSFASITSGGLWAGLQLVTSVQETAVQKWCSKVGIGCSLQSTTQPANYSVTSLTKVEVVTVPQLPITRSIYEHIGDIEITMENLHFEKK